MNAATFRSNRERLGLTTRWVAAELDVAERSVHRWESGQSSIPEGVVGAMDSWEALHDQYVAEADDPVTVPRAGDADGFPASWWRSVAAEARHERGHAISYEGSAQD